MLFNCISAFLGGEEAQEEATFLPSIEYEKKIMGFVDMKWEQDYKIYDVDLPQSKGHIHTLETGFHNKEVLVLVHGYAAAAVFYFKVIKELKDHFHIYSIDLFGMGSSARPKIENFEFQYIIDFFVEPLEEWRRALKLENFSLMGHSMGAYICAQYYKIKRPPIKMLYLLSPAGFTLRSDDELEQQVAKFGAARTKFIRYAWGMLHSKPITPFSFTVFGTRGSIKKYFGSGRLKLSDKEADVFTDYFASTLEKRLSGEKALGVILRYARYSNHPIANLLAELDTRGELKVPVKVLYGITDWMDSEHAYTMNERLDLHFDIITIDDSDHQIIYQNPKGIAKILKDDKLRGYDIITKEFNTRKKNKDRLVDGDGY